MAAFLVSAAFVGALPAAPLMAQETAAASLEGVVVDEDGLAVRGATITLRDTQTNASQVALSDSQGRFSETALVAGRTYEVTARGPEGKRTEPQTVTVSAGSNPELRLAYEVGIVVTGSFAGSLERSLDTKRRAATISDAVVAADIGKLPAANVAEALQRVPGVTIVREAGEGQFISVRGLGPNFQVVTLNGMPLAYNENIRNSGQSGRQFRLRVLPADLIDGIVVTKAPTADMVEGGIGSNADIRYIQPLERDSFVGINVAGNYVERADAFAPEGSLSAAWRNQDRTFGAFAGVSYSEREVQFERLRYGWTDAEIDGLGTVRSPGDIQPYLEQEERQRISAVAGLEWQPVPDVTLSLGGLYSVFNNAVTERRLTYYIPSELERLDLSTAVVEEGRLVAGTINGARIRNYTEFMDQSHENFQLNGSVEWALGDWTITPRVSYAEARSDLDTPISRVEYRTASGAGGNLTFDVSGDIANKARIPALVTDLDLTDPAAVPYYRFRIRPINSRDDDTTAILDISRRLDADLGGLFLTELRFGGQYSDRSRDYQRRDRDLRDSLRPGFSSDDPEFLGTLVPGNAFDQSIDRFQRWTSADIGRFGEAFFVDGEFDGAAPSAYDLEPTASDLRNSYRIGEEIWAAYGRLDFESVFGDVPVYGNIGVRYVATDTTVDGTQVVAVTDDQDNVTTETSPARFESSYSKWLPSFNANFELSRDVLLRLAVSRTMTRPSLSELRNSINTNSSTVSEIFINGAAALDDPTLELTASAGNPDLKPYTSWNADASLEWYFNEFGAFTVAAFHKSVSDYIASDVELRTLPFAVQDGSTLPVDVLVSTPVNVGDATITGLEFGFTGKLDSGFGVTATATFASTNLELDKEGQGFVSARVQGVSDTSFSITPFFQKGPFELNVSYTYRGDYLTDTGATVTSRPTEEDTSPFFQKGFGVVDLGAQFEFTDNVELYLQAVNILNDRQVSFQGSEKEVAQIHTFGRTFNFGVRARF